MKININGITRDMTPEEERKYQVLLADTSEDPPVYAEEESVIED